MQQNNIILCKITRIMLASFLCGFSYSENWWRLDVRWWLAPGVVCRRFSLDFLMSFSVILRQYNHRPLFLLKVCPIRQSFKIALININSTTECVEFDTCTAHAQKHTHIYIKLLTPSKIHWRHNTEMVSASFIMIYVLIYEDQKKRCLPQSWGMNSKRMSENKKGWMLNCCTILVKIFAYTQQK